MIHNRNLQPPSTPWYVGSHMTSLSGVPLAYETPFGEKDCSQGPVQLACVEDATCNGYRIDSGGDCFLYHIPSDYEINEVVTMTCAENTGDSYGALRADAFKHVLVEG